MTYLDELREEIDEVDRQLVELFEKRMEIVTGVAKYKVENNIPVLNSSREDQVIQKNIDYLKNKDLKNYLKDFFINLMDLSKDYQNHQIDDWR